MADDVALPANSGNVAADERSINSVTVKVQRVDELGSSAATNNQVNISNAAATIVAARETRKAVVIINRQTVSVFVGVATVTTSTGVELKPGDAIVLPLTALIQGITSAASPAGDRVHFIELYDS